MYLINVKCKRIGKSNIVTRCRKVETRKLQPPNVSNPFVNTCRLVEHSNIPSIFAPVCSDDPTIRQVMIHN